MSDPIGRLEDELAKLGEAHEPKPGWQARVLAATSPATPARRPRWWWFALPALAVAAIVAIVIGTRKPAEPDVLALAIDLRSGSAVVRGTSAKVGDVVHATASGGRHRAVWIYRDDRVLVLACPGAPAGCVARDGTLSGEVTLDAPGRYTVIALDGDAPLPPPTGSLDGDLAAAHANHVRTRTETIEVR